MPGNSAGHAAVATGFTCKVIALAFAGDWHVFLILSKSSKERKDLSCCVSSVQDL
jgi:hypothetical protein